MPLMLDLSPTMEARLQTEAQRRDLSVSDLVKMLLTQLQEHQDPASSDTLRSRRRSLMSASFV